jgi:hypothetical protein
VDNHSLSVRPSTRGSKPCQPTTATPASSKTTTTSNRVQNSLITSVAHPLRFLISLQLASSWVCRQGAARFLADLPLAPGFSPVNIGAKPVSRFNGIALRHRPKTAEAVLAARQSPTPG